MPVDRSYIASFAYGPDETSSNLYQALTFGVTSSTTAVTVTLSTSGSGTFTWSCGPAVN